MRPGLVVIGTLLLVLGLAAIGVVALVPAGTHESRNAITIPTQFLAPNVTNYALLPGTDTSDGTFSISWTATVPTYVRLYATAGCQTASPACASGAPIRSWTASLQGNWSISGDLGFPYLIAWNSSGPGAGSWGLTGLESVTTTLTTGFAQAVVIYLAGGALAAVGGVALFLGLFLRGGAYLGPAPPVSRSAEDAAGIAGVPPPRRP